MQLLKYWDTLIKPYFLTAGYALAYFTEMIWLILLYFEMNH